MRVAAIIAIFWPVTLAAQIFNPGNGVMFTDTEVPRVHILIHPDSLAELYLEENWYSNHEYPMTFVYQYGNESDTLYDVGFRFRGNTSRAKVKKSFKVSFNTFIPGRRYNGLKKLNLNAETNDPSMLRSNTTWHMFRDFGLAASRANHVEVYINGDFYGLYQNTEHINDDFAMLRFGDEIGNLYKCTYPADLNYISSNPDDYKMAPWGTRTYELQTNETLDDYTDLASFIGFLNNSGQNDFACLTAEHLDVYTYLKTIAIDVLSGNWDGHIYNKNNFYLYHNHLTDRFEYIAYDLDNTWGIDWLGQNWSNRNVYGWSPQGDQRPLYTRLMAVQAFKDIYSWHLRTMVQQYIQPQSFANGIESVQALITPSALADPYRPLDFGFGESDFLNALTESAGGHVVFPVLGFAQSRGIAALQQALPTAIAPIIWDVREDFSDFPLSVAVVVKTDGPAWSSLVLNYQINGIAQVALSTASAAAIHTFQVPLGANFAQLSFNITATGAEGLTRNAWCQNRIIKADNLATIVINEVMASNASTIADANGDFEDWIELHNYGTAALSLSGLYLTDISAAPKYWALPDIAIPAGSFLLIWADNERQQGYLHAPFKLSANGEQLFLMKSETNGISVVDHVNIPSIATDLSWGRTEDAQLPWILFDAPTPGASNGPLSSSNVTFQNLSLPYPNPACGELHLPQAGPYTIYDLRGVALLSGNGAEANLAALAMGVYILTIPSGHFKIVKSNNPISQ